jgi:amidohydrolase
MVAHDQPTDGDVRGTCHTAEVVTLALPPLIHAQFDEALRDQLIALRRDIHSHPELSNQEHRTAALLVEALRAAPGATVRRVGQTGVVGWIRGRSPAAPVVAIRGDIDALPIVEETGLPYASQEHGVMHACGHDVHATWAVGAAQLLAAEPAEGDVVVILQPAEELGSGATAMIAGGALDGVSAILGAHVDRRFEVGTIVADAGPVNAASDSFELVLRGTGAHAARPHDSRDPVVGAAALVTALQTIVSRRIDPARAAVVTIGSLTAGTAANIIPDRAVLRGTLRSFDPAVRAQLVEELKQIAQGVAAAHRLELEITLDAGTPSVINDAAIAEWVRGVAADLVGAEGVASMSYLNMGAEDFGYYLERVRGCFMRIGAREPGGEIISAHSPRFAPAEEALFVGAAVLAASARAVSARLANSALAGG